jgi:predicted CXXCH cytochrome family protein
MSKHLNVSRTAGGIAIALALAASMPARAVPIKTEVRKFAVLRGDAVKPLPKADAKYAMAPFQSGHCGVCHQNDDPNKPGPIRHATVNEQCAECHDDVTEVMKRRYKHVPAKEACTDCHNPHNSQNPALLHWDMVTLCTKCHAGIKSQVMNAKFKHDGAITKGKMCANCHNPHASNIEKLLIALPFNLCVNCHSKDGMVASDGTSMTNYKAWLDDNKHWHDPVKNKDCSACHKTHGGDNFRMLVSAYPDKFYAAYDRKNYALCFGCHNEKVVSQPETTTLTGFRDGSRNLHYVHVNKERGRTCRACHEVHASKQDNHIRDAVPYGPKGWLLQIGYTKTATGGQCTKTCHDTQTYNNKTLTGATPASVRAQ